MIFNNIKKHSCEGFNKLNSKNLLLVEYIIEKLNNQNLHFCIINNYDVFLMAYYHHIEIIGIEIFIGSVLIPINRIIITNQYISNLFPETFKIDDIINDLFKK